MAAATLPLPLPPPPPPAAPKTLRPAASPSAVAALTPLITETYRSSTLTFHLNGAAVTLANPHPSWTLLDFLRAQPGGGGGGGEGLRGTKLGCGEGGCGACTVVLQMKCGDSGRLRFRHRAVNACLFPLVGVDGKHVITVEGIGDVSRPHPLQERIAKLHGSQCGFCTPGIVMSLYALIRNAYDPDTKRYRLSARDIESEGHLDGNLCRCTGYKPILQAARTFITEDLHGELIETSEVAVAEDGDAQGKDVINYTPNACSVPSRGSCGRPGGCCRDNSPDSSKSSDAESASTKSNSTSASSYSDANPPAEGAAYAKPVKSREQKPSSGSHPEGVKTRTTLDTSLPTSEHGVPQIQFAPYTPSTELIFPPALAKYEPKPLCYGNERKLWFRPTTLEQLIRLKGAYPSAKLVAGASEVQVEVRFKNSDFAVSVYIADIEELRRMNLPSDAELETADAVSLGANTPLTEVEAACKRLHKLLGQRGLVFEALGRQLRYFAGRQIRNVASLAGNLATASPISDANPVLLAAGASLVAQSETQGAVTLPLTDFFVAYRTTALPADAVITQIRIPVPPTGARRVVKAYKQAKRKDDDIAIVTAAFRVDLHENGEVKDAAFAYGGMAPMTVLARRATAAAIGKLWTAPETLQAVLDALDADFDLSFSVPGGMAHYRKALALSLFVKFWHEAIAELGLGPVDRHLIGEIERDISTGTRDNYNPLEQRVVGKQVAHLSALKHCTGEAEYVDDIPPQTRELFGGLVLSAKAHAKIVSVDWTPALSLPGVIGYIDKHSIPHAANMWGSIRKDEPFFADGEVLSHGQTIGMVYADTALQAQAAAKSVMVVYEELPAILTIDEAIKANSFFPHGRQLKKGAAITGTLDETFAKCEKVFEGVSRMGGQEHFYLETQAALAIPHAEDGSMEIWSSTQNCMETQEFVSQVTGVPSNRINARVKRMGGAFGGKESRSVPIACLCAIAAKKERRPVRLMLTREEDMMTTGQRHPIQARWKVGVNDDGKIVCLDVDVYDNAGYSQDMSGAVMDRCCTHLENCYEIPHVWIRGHVCRTNTHSNTAFRGFGGPQGMYVAEQMMATIAEGLDIDVDELRLRNLYKQGDYTPFFQRIDEDWHIPTMLEQLKKNADYDARKKAVAEFNAANTWRKRGISLLPSKFGISFATALHLNQAGAYVKIYADGSILLHHGGTEMGQGLYTKMCQVAAQELGVPLDAVFTQDSQSYQIANASPTAASSGSDLNGMAVKDACDQLNERLRPYRERFGPDAPMKTIAHAAYLDRVNLAANGFWKMPKVGFQWGEYDPSKVKPMYYYFTQGVAVSEVELDVLTGDHTVLRTDILMDVGQSINPAIDYGQIEGAFVQGQGLFTIEESLWTRTGELATRGPGTYKIPGFNDIPQIFNVSMLRHDGDGNALTWTHLRSIQSSKGVGEPPLFLGATVFFALREAVRAARQGNGVRDPLVLESPATAERLRLAVADKVVVRTEVRRREGERGFFVRVA